MHTSLRVAAALILLLLLTAGVIYEVRSLNRNIERPSAAADLAGGAPTYDCSEDRPDAVVGNAHDGLLDVTAQVGIDFQHIVGPLGTYFMPESIGAGGALFDADNDGLTDLYLINCGASPKARSLFMPGTRTENRLYLQTADHRFVDATERSGLGDTGYGAGCAIGDLNNDGLPDVFVANYERDRVFRNLGDGRFLDVTEASGFVDSGWGTCAAMLDYDRDGWLDVVVVNYTRDDQYGHSVACGFQLEHRNVSYCGPRKFQTTIDHLYHNESSSVSDQAESPIRLRDVTQQAGLDQADSYGFGVACADFTGDHWPDIFIANDSDPNRLWVNQRNGTFIDEAVQRGVAFNGGGVPEAGMGVASGDLNGDLIEDLIVSHLSKETSTVYLSDGAGGFLDRTAETGVAGPSRRHTGWGIALTDLNLDGFPDLPMVDGLVIPCHSGFAFHGEDMFQERNDTVTDSAAFWREYADDNVLLMGRPDGQFEYAAAAVSGDFTSTVASGRSLICGDYDNDGDVDLVVTNCGTSAKLYRNEIPRAGHWLTVRCLDPAAGNRDSIGAVIQIVTDRQRWSRTVMPQSGYLSSHDVRAHFGVGAADSISEIIIRWPDGPMEDSVERFDSTTVDRHLTLVRGTGTSVRVHDP